MQLKDYQDRVVKEVGRFLDVLENERSDGNAKHGSLDAWSAVGLNRYTERKNELGEDLPTFCIKVPTGGGKTLIATQVLGSIYKSILKDRNGAGLVLWVVPSSQIYNDTLKRLRNRRDLYRLMLEHAVSRRVEVWEKQDIARLSPVRLRDCFNILLLQLASTNRETKEQLKFFKDSGGNIVKHFPRESDPAAHKELKEEVPNLDMLVDDDERGEHLAKTSIGNMVRLCKPAVILDEGHKATSQLARDTIEGFNASVVVELSATPQKEANILCRVTGQELLDEEMIKLPLNIATSGQKAWKDILTQARDKREHLARCAAKLHKHKDWDAEKVIQPIVLVQVERTGDDQREPKYVHSEDVKKFLIERLSILEEAIKIKTASKNDIENIDLMEPGCPVQWIITKSALQEGWDCPNAYILVSLNATKSAQAMTQLVGRILRQPHQKRTPIEDLNESYVYCLRATATEVARQVKSALEKEGYEGDKEGIVVDASGGKKKGDKRSIRIREEFRSLYNAKPYEGKVYLPKFCVKVGNEYESLDYFRHLVGKVSVDDFEFDGINWPLEEKIREAKDRFYRVTIGEDMARAGETESDLIETDDQVLAWMVATLRFDYLSHKQLKVIVRRVYKRLIESELSSMVKDRFALVKFPVRKRIEDWIQQQIDQQTEQVFGNLFEKKRIRFYLECVDCRFEIPPSVQVYSTRPLTHEDGGEIKKSLFDYVEHEGQNEYERAVAICLDRHANVLWWFRNKVGPENFTVQGYKRNRIYPDFVVQSGKKDKPVHQVVVIESKGKHLEGNPDTQYKREIAKYFGRAGNKVSWQKLGEGFKDHVFRFQILDQEQNKGRDWSDQLSEYLEIE
jgi:type III restriction enzyme